MDRLDTLEERFRTAAREFPAVEERCLSQVATWRWANNPLFDLRPLRFQRSGHSPGRWIKKKPETTKVQDQPCEYGLDSQGQPVIERRHFWGSEERYERRFFLRELDYWEELQFDAQKKWPSLLNVCRVEVRESRPVSAAWYSKNQKGFEDYLYEGERLVRVSGAWSNEPFGPRQLLCAQWNLEYDDTGEVVRILITYQPTEGHPGGTFQAYRRRSK